MLVRNKAGKLFLGERAGESGVWQFPQGGVEENQTAEESVLRELNEELGIKPHLLKIVMKFNSIHEYDFKKPKSYSGVKWRGQSQTFWLVDFLGEDKDINLDFHEKEFESFKWCTPDEIVKFAEPKRVRGYMGPLEEFRVLSRKG